MRWVILLLLLALMAGGVQAGGTPFAYDIGAFEYPSKYGSGLSPGLGFGGGNFPGRRK